MALTINSNIAALNTQRNLGISNSKLGKSLERLSSGLRINRASDDAAGMAIATKFAAQVKGLNQAVRNANNAITLLATAEGGINTLTNILQRLRELAVQSASDDNTAGDRANLDLEATGLVSELTRQVNVSEYNTAALLDGSYSGKFFQIGANYSQNITFSIADSRAKTLGGRAEYDADIADGVLTAVDANFGASEFKIAGKGVAATTSSDDQVSVLEITSAQLSSLADLSNLSGTFSFMVNNTAVEIAIASGMTGGSIADRFVSAVNAAGITNVSAVVINDSQWTLRATKGTNIELGAASGTGGGTSDAVGDFLYLVAGASDTIVSLFGSLATSAGDIISYNGESSAIAKAAAINEVKGTSGVQATIQENTTTGSSAVVAGSLSAGDLYINGVNIGAVTVLASDSNGALTSAINNLTADTGVTADTDDDGKLILSASDGRNITVTTQASGDFTSIMGMDSGYLTNTTAVFRSTVRLNDDSSFELSGTLADLYDNGTTAALNNVKTTATSNSVTASTATYNAAGIALDTRVNAEAAILTIDAALDDVNTTRASIGAVQNRIEFTVANLEIASENMSAAESRIRDADFAFEVTLFTKNQIMVQAATAMLAQANTAPQIALQLLG